MNLFGHISSYAQSHPIAWLSGLRFVWLTDAIASWEEDKDADEPEQDSDEPDGTDTGCPMLDTKTGAIRFDGITTFFSPSIRRSELLRTGVAKKLKEFVKNEPWCSFKLGSAKGAGLDWTVVFWFNGEKLWRVQLVTTTSASEELGKDDYNRIVREVLGVSKTKHKWGSIESNYNERDAYGTIFIEYK